MKVLHFTTTVGAGGAETMLCNLVEQLDRRGVTNVVVSTTSSLADNSLRPRIERHASFIDLQSSSLLSPSFLSAFRAVLQREKPDIIQTWMHTAGLTAGVLARTLGLRHIVWGIHSKDLLRFEDNPLLRACFGRLLGLGAALFPQKIVSCSQTGLRIHHQSYGYPRHKMIWIGNGIDTARFRPNPEAGSTGRQKLGIPAGAPVIGMMGRLHPVKDVPTFLRAAALLQSSRKDVHFVFCGDDPASADPETSELAARLPSPAHFHWLGFRSDAENVYPLFDLLTLTSVSEAYPMVLIEAMACGVPCVSTDAGDASLILAHLGHTVPVRDPDSLAAAWNSLLDLPPHQRADLAGQVRERAVSEFGLEACGVKYNNLYEELVTA